MLSCQVCPYSLAHEKCIFPSLLTCILKKCDVADFWGLQPFLVGCTSLLQTSISLKVGFAVVSHSCFGVVAGEVERISWFVAFLSPGTSMKGLSLPTMPTSWVSCLDCDRFVATLIFLQAQCLPAAPQVRTVTGSHHYNVLEIFSQSKDFFMWSDGHCLYCGLDWEYSQELLTNELDLNLCRISRDRYP